MFRALSMKAPAGNGGRSLFEKKTPRKKSPIHGQGMPAPAAQDGNPMSPVPSGSRRVYEFVLPADSAGSYWYHLVPPASAQALGRAGVPRLGRRIHRQSEE